MSALPPPAPTHASGIPDSTLAGPFPVGEYAAALRARLRSFVRVQLVGELVNLRPSQARVYFELRDATGAIPSASCGASPPSRTVTPRLRSLEPWGTSRRSERWTS